MGIRQVKLVVSPTVPSTATIAGTFFRVVAILPATLSAQTGAAGSETAPGTVLGSTIGYTASVLIRPDGGNFASFKTGQGRHFTDKPFAKLEIQSQGTRSLTVILAVGDFLDTTRIYQTPMDSVVISRGVQTANYSSPNAVWFPTEILQTDGQVAIQRQIILGNPGLTTAGASYTAPMGIYNATNYVDNGSTVSANDLVAILPAGQMFTVETTSALAIAQLTVPAGTANAWVTVSQICNLIPAIPAL